MDKNNLNKQELNDTEKETDESEDRFKRSYLEKILFFNEVQFPKFESSSAQQLRKARHDRRVIIFLSSLVCLLIIFGNCLVFKAESKAYDKYPMQASVGSQIVNNIKFCTAAPVWNDKSMSINVSVENSSSNNFYVTVHSIVLKDQSGKEYFPDLAEGDISTMFYGQKIKPGSKVTANIVFDDIPKDSKNSTLIISNVSDVYHFSWDYLIELP